MRLGLKFPPIRRTHGVKSVIGRLFQETSTLRPLVKRRHPDGLIQMSSRASVQSVYTSSKSIAAPQHDPSKPCCEDGSPSGNVCFGKGCPEVRATPPPPGARPRDCGEKQTGLGERHPSTSATPGLICLEFVDGQCKISVLRFAIK